MSAPSSTPLPADIVKITEPLILGYLLQWALFGVLSVQVYIYYLAFPNDPLQSKLLVYAVYAAEIVQAVLFTRVAYLQFAVGFGNFEALDAVPTIAWFGLPVLSSIVAAVVQIFYAHRTKLLGGSYLIPSVIVLLALLQLGGGITLGVLVSKTPFFSQMFNKKTFTAAGILYGASAVCDVLIAVYMTYLLSQRKSDLKRRLVQKLTHLIIETGVLTAALAIANFVLFLIPIKAAAFYSTTSAAILGKMYSNTMMVVLNSRMAYGIAVNDTVSNEVSSPSPVTFRRSAFFTSQPEGISVTREQRSWSDPLEHPLEDFKAAANLDRLEDSMESLCVATEAVPKKSTERRHQDSRGSNGMGYGY